MPLALEVRLHIWHACRARQDPSNGVSPVVKGRHMALPLTSEPTTHGATYTGIASTGGTASHGKCLAHWATHVCQVSSLSYAIWWRRLRKNREHSAPLIPKTMSSGRMATLETCSTY
ncbi:hypothetical protein DPMN_040958 [Dreissena polymorpha]|uniref:Uncharacterized protein n=1 Tax=Dreissena polymorpha TaxID=45954 RepID=A0A9D4CXP0_DREPO|nr:hypothetical protein DPMN_040958 [Dreissena polymorpha]